MRNSRSLPTRRLMQVIFLAVAVVLILIAVPMLTGQVSPNATYGVRLPLTTSDPDLWYTVNAVAGAWIAALAALTALLALVLYRRPGPDQRYAFRVLFPLLAGALLGLLLLRVTYLR